MPDLAKPNSNRDASEAMTSVLQKLRVHLGLEQLNEANYLVWKTQRC